MGAAGPAPAALVAVSVAAVVSWAAGSVWFTVRLQGERDIAVWERGEAERQRQAAVAAQADAEYQAQQARSHQQRAETSYQLARKGLEKAVKKVAEDPRLQSGPLEDLRRVAQEAELVFYQEFVKLRGDEPAFRVEQGRAHLRIGRLYHAFGRVAEAETAFREAGEIFTRLAAEFPREPDYRQALMSYHRDWGYLLDDTSRHVEAEQHYLKALALETQLTQEYPAECFYRSCQATILDALATLYQTEMNRLREAEEAYQKSLSIRKTLVRERPRDADYPDYHIGLGHSLHNLGVLYAKTERGGLAEQAYRDARLIFLDLTREFPDLARYRADLALNHRMLGDLYRKASRFEEAEKEYDQARVLWQELADKHPAVPAYRADLASIFSGLAILYEKTGRPVKAAQAYDHAQVLRKNLADKHTGIADYRLDLANSHHNMGLFHAESGRSKEAEQAYLNALATKKALVHDNPLIPRYRADLATTYHNLGWLYEDANRLQEAEQAFREALALREALVRDYPDALEYRAKLANSKRGLGYLYRKMRRLQEAAQAVSEALDIQKPLVRDAPTSKYQADLARSYNLLGLLYDDTAERRTEAERAYREAVKIQEGLVRKHPTVMEYVLDLGGMCCNLGHVVRDSGRPEEALACYGQALAALQTVLNKQPQDVKAREYLHNTHAGRAKALIRLNCLQEAEQANQEALAALRPPTPDNPSDPRYRHQRADYFNDLGIRYYKAQQYPEAERAYREALTLWQGLVREHPADAGYALGLGGTQCNLGHVMRDGDRLEASLDWYGRAVATLEPLRARQPQHPNVRKFLRFTYSGRAEALTRLGRHAEALKDLNQALELADGPGETLRLRRALTLARLKEYQRATVEADALVEAKNATARTLYDAARVYSLSAAAGTAADKSGERYAARAVELLHKALAKDPKLGEELARDQDLDGLRQREDFQQLRRELEKKKTKVSAR